MSATLFGALADPVRRQILELLAAGEQSAGVVVDTVSAQRQISQPAISQHLKVLRQAGVVTVRADGARRLYALNLVALEQAASWLHELAERRGRFDQALDALDTEVARGRRAVAGGRPASDARRDVGTTSVIGDGLSCPHQSARRAAG